MPYLNGPSGRGQAMVLAARLTEPPERAEERLGFVWPLLSLSQQSALKASQRASDRALRLLARALLIKALTFWGLDGRRLIGQLTWSSQGQPSLADYAVSFSHSYPYGVCLLSRRPGGVDVESRASDLTPNDCAAIFRPQELAAILAAPDRGSELIRRFTIKEAVLKAQGVGFLGDPLTVETTRPEEKIKPTKTRAAQIDRPDHLAYGHLDLAPDFWLTWAGSWSSRPRPLTFLGLKAWLF